ncbi:hypothetical protein KC614_04370, partial [candidate division WWE3 bacterium]|nr:hypothetical protein [candidate division WWE3 bacterium]
FYKELVELDEIEKMLNEIEISEVERTNLLDTVHKTIQIEIVKFVLDEIPQGQHEDFLRFLHQKPADESLGVFVKRSVENFENRARDLITHVQSDFKNAVLDYLETSEEWLEGDLGS